MSDRSFSGLIQIDEEACGMITLRADLAEAAGAGIEVPEQGMVKGDTLWMSPDELMILCGHEEADAQAASLNAMVGQMHSLVVNVSDARVMFRLTGRSALIRETLAKLSPADLRSNALPVRHIRRTRLAQVAAAFWFVSEEEARLICFRSVSDYVFGLLCNAASEGSEVAAF